MNLYRTQTCYITSHFLQSHTPLWFFYNSATAPSVPRPPHYWRLLIILRHTTLSRTPLDGWSARCRELYLTIFNNRQTSMPPNRIQNHNPSKWTAVDPCLKPCGHWDRFWFSELRKCRLVCYESTLTVFWQYLIKIIINKINDNHIANKNNSGLIYCL